MSASIPVGTSGAVTATVASVAHAVERTGAVVAEREPECKDGNHIYQFRDGVHRCIDCGQPMIYIPETREWKKK